MDIFYKGMRTLLMVIAIVILAGAIYIMYCGVTGKDFPFVNKSYNEYYDKDYKVKEKQRIKDIDKKLQNNLHKNKEDK